MGDMNGTESRNGVLMFCQKRKGCVDNYRRIPCCCVRKLKDAGRRKTAGERG